MSLDTIDSVIRRVSQVLILPAATLARYFLKIMGPHSPIHPSNKSNLANFRPFWLNDRYFGSYTTTMYKCIYVYMDMQTQYLTKLTLLAARLETTPTLHTVFCDI